MKEIEKNT